MVKDKIGADLKCLDMGSGEMISRVTAEAGNPQNDVNFGNDDTVHKTLAAKGLLEPYKGPGWQSLPAHLKDPEGRWVGLYLGVIGFAYHPDRLKKLGVDPPTSWQDLLNPKLKGEVVLASPAASGTAYTVLYSIIHLYGEEGGFKFMKDLDKNIAYYSKGGSEPAEKVALGEYAVGIAFTHDIQTRIARGLPVKISHPKEGTGWEIGGMSIVKGAKHMEAAKAFVDLALTPEAQALHPLTSYRIPVLPGVKVPAGTYTLEDVKILPLDRDKMGQERDRLTKKWDAEIGSKR
jgi:iron(III) transport system substrate-binding protein